MAGTADQQVLVTDRRRDIAMTAVDLMHAGDQAQFFQLFQRAVYGNQPDIGYIWRASNRSDWDPE
jgi:hypothetical protein